MNNNKMKTITKDVYNFFQKKYPNDMDQQIYFIQNVLCEIAERTAMSYHPIDSMTEYFIDRFVETKRDRIKQLQSEIKKIDKRKMLLQLKGKI